MWPDDDAKRFNHWISGNRQPYSWWFNIWKQMSAMETEMEKAFDEAVPEEKPEVKTHMVTTKIVRRNGKIYRITIQQVSTNETEDELGADETQEFDEDFSEDNA